MASNPLSLTPQIARQQPNSIGNVAQGGACQRPGGGGKGASPVSTYESLQASQLDLSGVGDRGPPFLEAAADTLGLAPEDLDAQLRSGETLASIAEQEDVSEDELRDALAQEIQEKHPDTSADEATRIANGLIHGHHHKGHHQAAPPDLDPALAFLANTVQQITG